MRQIFNIPFLLSLCLVWVPLAACSNSTQQSPSPEAKHSADDGHDHSKDGEDHSEDDGHDHSKEEEGHSVDDGHGHSEHELHSRGGQVVESDPYHIELVTKLKDDETQLNLYLLHEAEDRAITDAQVTANVQQPDGEQQTVKLVYEPAKKSYTGLLTAQESGQYNLVIQADINGEKVNSRFSIEK